MLKSIKIIALLLILIFIISACSNSKSSLVGMWENVDDGYEIEFYDNGTVVSDSGTGQYTTEGNQLRILNMGLMGQVIKWEYEINGDTMTIEWQNANREGDKEEYRRVTE